MTRSEAPDRVLICNPASGDENHVGDVTERAHGAEFAVRVTAEEGDARRFAREAGDAGAELVVAAGGDGTVNEVVAGLVEADALAETALAVVPVGTGNNFASNLGIEGVPDAFAAIERDDRRWIDLGFANDRPFVNSCVGGITAEASAATTPEQKRRFGLAAYVGRTIEAAVSFDAPPIRATLERDSPRMDERPTAASGATLHERWDGEALFVLVGNCRRFTTARRAQANVEDGLFEVTIVERAPAVDLVEEATLGELLDRTQTHIVRRRVPSLTLESQRSAPIEYSLDGEVLAAERLELETDAQALEVVVGEGYRVDPDGSDGAEPA